MQYSILLRQNSLAFIYMYINQWKVLLQSEYSTHACPRHIFQLTHSLIFLCDLNPPPHFWVREPRSRLPLPLCSSYLPTPHFSEIHVHPPRCTYLNKTHIVCLRTPSDFFSLNYPSGCLLCPSPIASASPPPSRDFVSLNSLRHTPPLIFASTSPPPEFVFAATILNLLMITKFRLTPPCIFASITPSRILKNNI